jgi:hypothetical protein
MMQITQAITNAIEPFFVGMKADMDNVKSDVNELRTDTGERLKNLEENEALTHSQVSIIDHELDHHTSKLLGITWTKRGMVAEECIVAKQRYYGRLRARTIGAFKRSLGYSNAFSWIYLPRKHFEDIVDFIRHYEPVGGVEDFKESVDRELAAKSKKSQ